MKKVFIISSITLLVILLFWGVYNFAFKEKKSGSPEIVKKEETVPPEKKQEKPKEKIYSLSDEAVISPTISKDGEHITYYARSNGNVYEVSLKGTSKRTISSEDLKGLENIFWSPDRNKVISKFNKDGKTNFYLYDYATKEGKRLKSGIDIIVWTNLGDKIIYKHFDSQTKKRSINIANPDGGNWEKLADTTLRFLSLATVPQTSLISFWNTPNGFEETSLQIVGVTGGEAKTIFSKKFGADYLWAPNGGNALVSSAEIKGSSKIMLALINSNGGGYQNLSIPTLTSKCVWSSDNKTVFYALPGSIPEGSVMPNDYQDKKVTTKDTFWKVDVTSGKKERIVELEDMKGSFDASYLFLSPSEEELFFVNRTDGKLYGINL